MLFYEVYFFHAMQFYNNVFHEKYGKIKYHFICDKTIMKSLVLLSFNENNISKNKRTIKHLEDIFFWVSMCLRLSLSSRQDGAMMSAKYMSPVLLM